ncbi:MAG: hypothetical protein JO008_04425 [Alphaproteobacteria bacterium]|nr:hypothetical protein [Alphaproteobacteria bacterium]
MKRREGNNSAVMAIALMLSAFLVYASSLSEQKRSDVIATIVNPIRKLYMLPLPSRPPSSFSSPGISAGSEWARAGGD